MCFFVSLVLFSGILNWTEKIIQQDYNNVKVGFPFNIVVQGYAKNKSCNNCNA